MISTGALNEGTKAGSPRGRFGCIRFPATTAYGVSGSASRLPARLASHRVALARPEPREPEVELHHRGLGGPLGELLEPVERPVGQRASAVPTFASSESCGASSAAAPSRPRRA